MYATRNPYPSLLTSGFKICKKPKITDGKIKAAALILKTTPNPCNKYPLVSNSSNVV
jgi:hypothetical protein